MFGFGGRFCLPFSLLPFLLGRQGKEGKTVGEAREGVATRGHPRRKGSKEKGRRGKGWKEKGRGGKGRKEKR